MPQEFPKEGRPTGKVGAAELEQIVGRLTPLAALGFSSRRAMAMLAAGDAAPAPQDAADLLELAAWDPAIAANCLAATKNAPPSASSARSFGPSPGSSPRIRADLGTIGPALAMLGERAVGGIALAALGRHWPAAGSGGLDRQEFWRHCIAVALAARMLAETSGLNVDPAQAAAWGLLHDLGKLGLLQATPKSYARVLDSLRVGGGGDLASREQEMLGVDHGLFGRRMAQRWRLGEGLEEAIWLHHQPADSPAMAGDTALRAGLVQIADGIARELQLGFSGNSAPPPPAAALAARLDLPDEVLASVRESLPRECARLCDRLGVGEAPATAGGRAWARLAEVNLDRLTRQEQDLRHRAGNLAPGAKAMELLARFGEARRPEEPLSELLAGVARLAGEAVGGVGEEPSLRRPIVAYAISSPQEGVVAVRLCAGETSSRTLALCGPLPERPPARGDGEAGNEPAHAPAPPRPTEVPATAAGAMESLLEDPAALADWLDAAACDHVPLFSAGHWVGGLLLPAPVPAGAGDVLAALAGVLGAWLATALQRRRVAALGERLAEAWPRLAAQRDSFAEAKALAAVGEMAAGAAHEINNPLAVISGRAQLMAERAAGAEEKKAWRLIVEQAQRISDLLTSLVELARPPRPSLARLAVAGLFSEAAGAFAAGTHPKAAALKVDIEIATDVPPALADRSRLVAVLCELLANAAAAGAQRVVFGAREGPEGELVLSVADDGPGMDAATAASAFTPLFSRQAANRRRGLGLSLARRTVEAGGGKMWLRSRPGGGTSVFLQLPVAGGEEKA